MSRHTSSPGAPAAASPTPDAGSGETASVPALSARLPWSRTRTRITAVAAGLVLVLGTGGAAGARTAAPEPPWQKAVERALDSEKLDGGMAGVVISDASDGRVLYQRQAGTRLMPASNTKLLTSAAAMDVLGPDYRYNTDVLAHGERHGDRLDGDLYLRGTGDPTLLAEDYDALASDIADAGIGKVTGDLVADDTRFDSQRLGASWAADDESAYYSSQISALSLAPDEDYDTGSVRLEVSPGADVGEKPKVKVAPSNRYVDVDVTAETVAADGSDTISVDREHGGNTITVSGGIPAGADPAESWTSVWEPTGYAASVFADALLKHGVQVDGGTKTGKATPDGAQRLARHASMPLKKINFPFMKLSNNNHAEVLTKTMGYETAQKGTWSAGLKAIDGFLKSSGVDTEAIRQVDGSGLSRMDNVSAGEFATLLHSVRKKPWFKQWRASLPVACASDRLTGGTLRSRMCDTPAEGNVHAKTGSLTGASALSGYVTDADGRELVFSIVLNNFLPESVKDVEDKIVVALASSGKDSQDGKGGQNGDDAEDTKRSGSEPRAGAGAAGGALECSWAKPARC